MGAVMRLESIDALAIKPHAAGLAGEGAADAIDQRALAGAVRADQADAFASGNREINAVKRHEAAEAFAETFDLQQGGCIHGASTLTRRRPIPSTRRWRT